MLILTTTKRVPLWKSGRLVEKFPPTVGAKKFPVLNVIKRVKTTVSFYLSFLAQGSTVLRENFLPHDFSCRVSEGMCVNIQVLQLCRMLPKHPISFYPIQNSEVCQVTGEQRVTRSGEHQRDTDPTNNCMGSIRKPIPKPLVMPLLQIPPTVLQAPLTFCKTHPHRHTPILWPGSNAQPPQSNEIKSAYR